MEQLKYLVEFLSKPEYAMGIQTLVLGITALIIFIYTYHTWKLWRESKIQTDLAQTPYLILRFNFNEKCWFIKNIGSLAATKIEIEGCKIFYMDREKKRETRFDCIEMLEPKEEKKIQHRIFVNNNQINSDNWFHPFIIPIPNTKHRAKVKFRISYKNIFGNKFYFMISVGEKEYIVEKFGKDKLITKLKYIIIQKLEEIYNYLIVKVIRTIKKIKSR